MTDPFVHETAVVDENVSIGDNTSVWHFSHVMTGAEIGAACTLGQNVYIGRDVVVGDNVKIQNNVSVYQGVHLEDDVFCGPSMVFTNVGQPRSAFPKETSAYEETHVGQGCTIGANVTVICGNDLGRWSFIGAGSVVTEPVPDFSLQYGNPAKHEGWACVCGELNHDAENGNWRCPSCDRCYEFADPDEPTVVLKDH